MHYVLLPEDKDKETTYVLNKWYKKIGDAVRVGDALASYEQDKGAVDLISEFDGVLREMYAKEGDVVPAGGRIGMIS